ncbi:MarR family transcriptional regulator [Lacticaseibacillus paracasei]|uniref:MarR family transcriptional regulator n=1 Tax=Lacticaseibacillus paracasei TaxID=1597 RepID=A0ABD6W031_LACPA|nr:MarR family transcriptional regulator [Lacticaseibacillus paracasei]POE42051.1 MarR family transcriptional regulator [Lacticaseibacillus paracasei]
MSQKPSVKRINDKLIRVYTDILRMEEEELRKSQFRDLCIKEMHTIDAIGIHATPSSSDVAKRLHVTQGTLSVAINNLARKGYVERLHLESDKRVVNLRLSRKGRLMYRAHLAFHQKMVASFVKGFTEPQIELIERALDNLNEFIDEYRH